MLGVEDINRVVLTGKLVRDSAFGYTAGGTPIASFTLAFSSDPNKQRNVKEEKGLVDVIFFGAESCMWAETLKEGTQVIIKGRLKQRSWRTSEGIHKSKTEIIANQVECYDSGKGEREAYDIESLFKGGIF